MANIKSQIKRNRQNEQAHERNKAVKSRVKTFVKRFMSAAEASDKEAASEAYLAAARELDVAASKGVLHKNNAAHRKSKMAKRLGAL